MKKRKIKIIKDPKARGEWVESVFMARAGELGFAVSRPWGDSRSYDFVVGRPGHFVGVQVKSTTIESGGGYACVIRKQGKAYPRGSFDFVAAYVVPEDVWYIIPASKVWDKECVTVCSESPQAQYEEYREAWHLLHEAERSKKEAGAEVAGTVEEPAVAEEAGSQFSPFSAFGRMEKAMKEIQQRLERDKLPPSKSRDDV
jgi:hypothetical protein